jgi:hypothetical protein
MVPRAAGSLLKRSKDANCKVRQLGRQKRTLLPSELRLLGVLPGWRRNSEHTDHGEEADEEFFATGARNHAKCREAQENVQEGLAIW